MSSVKDMPSLYTSLKTEWAKHCGAKKSRKLEKCGELLNQLKIGLTQLTFLPSNASSEQEDLLLARDILEIGVQWAVSVKDIRAFERYMAQLKCYYLDYKRHLPESALEYQLLGLNLLFLLSQNRVAEFHMELELLPAEIIQSNPFIRHAVALEQYLMEGRYNKIFLAKGNVPAESYTVFMDTLLETVRGEIAACLEKAYQKVSICEAARKLNVNQKDLMEYAQKRSWTLGPDNCYHFHSSADKPDEPLSSLKLAVQVITYARELEMIV